MCVCVCVFLQQPPGNVEGYNVSIGSMYWPFDSSTNSVELAIDSLTPCNENGREMLRYTATVAGYNSLGETETASSTSFCEYYVMPTLHLQYM